MGEVRGARQMVIADNPLDAVDHDGPDGDPHVVYVGTHARAGTACDDLPEDGIDYCINAVWAMVETDGAYGYEHLIKVIDGLANPSGVAYHQDTLYIATLTDVLQCAGVGAALRETILAKDDAIGERLECTSMWALSNPVDRYLRVREEDDATWMCVTDGDIFCRNLLDLDQAPHQVTAGTYFVDDAGDVEEYNSGSDPDASLNVVVDYTSGVPEDFGAPTCRCFGMGDPSSRYLGGDVKFFPIDGETVMTDQECVDQFVACE